MVMSRLDVATVFSLLPVEVKESKPGLYPGEYLIPPAPARGDFSLLLVHEGSHFVPQLERAPYQAVTPAREIAKSLVDDYIEGSLGIEEDAGPGLFWAIGEYTKEKAKIELKNEIVAAEAKQNRWYVNLVRIADIEWAQHVGNHNVISTMMRHAAKHLGLEKEWLINPDQLTLVYCPVCRNNVSVHALVCGNCQAILKPEEYKKFQFANANVKA